MNNELKTLKDIKEVEPVLTMAGTIIEKVVHSGYASKEELKQEAIKIFKNLQGPETIYPILLENFPDDIKGSIAKGMWNDSKFRYGSEYGMLAMLMYFFNITEEDLK